MTMVLTGYAAKIVDVKRTIFVHVTVHRPNANQDINGRLKIQIMILKYGVRSPETESTEARRSHNEGIGSEISEEYCKIIERRITPC